MAILIITLLHESNHYIRRIRMSGKTVDKARTNENFFKKMKVDNINKKEGGNYMSSKIFKFSVLKKINIH